MAIKLENLAGSLVAFMRSLGSTSQPGAGEGVLGAHLEDLNGRPLPLLNGQAVNAAQYGLPLVVQNDNNALMLRGDRSGGVAVATTQPLLSWFIEGTTFNSRLLLNFAATFTAAQTAQSLVLNSGLSTAVNQFYQLLTAKLIPVHMKAPILMRCRARFTQWQLANANIDYGFTNVNTSLGATANLNGAYWRADAAGVMPVLAINGAVAVTGTDVSSLLNVNNFYHWGILRDDDSITFTVQDSSTGRVVSRQVLQVPNGQQKAFLTSHIQPYIRVFNGGTAPTTAPQVLISEWTIGLLDTNLNMTQSQIATCMGLGSETGPLNYTTTSNITNAAVAPTTVPTNTAATITALDGAQRMTAPAGSTNDLALFSYTVPAPYQHRTKRVIVAAKNLGAIVATTPTQIDYYLAYNGTTSLVGNLARKYIGTQTFPVGAAIGSSALEGRLELNLAEADAVTEAGRVVTLVARISTGTATAGQVIETNYANLGHFE